MSASYLDAVAMGSFYGGNPNTPDNVTTELTGHGIPARSKAAIRSDHLYHRAPNTRPDHHCPKHPLRFRFRSFQHSGVPRRHRRHWPHRIAVGGQSHNRRQIQPRLIANFWDSCSGNDTRLFNSVTALSCPSAGTRSRSARVLRFTSRTAQRRR